MNRFIRPPLLLIFIITACLFVSCADMTAAVTQSINSPSSSYSQADTVSQGYYVVNIGDKAGVVDSYGKMILPAEYSRIEILRYEGSPVVFLASDGAAHIKKGEGDSNGGLFDAGGKLLLSGNFRSGYVLTGGIIALADNDYKYGLVSFSGEEIIPFKYMQVYLCVNEIVAVSGNFDNPSRIFDVYDLKGSLLRTKELRSRFLYYDGTSKSKDIIISDKLGSSFGLINTQFDEILPAEWDSISPAGDNAYIIRKYNEARLVDYKGKDIVSGHFTDIQPNYISSPASVFMYDSELIPTPEYNETLIGFSASGNDGAYVFDTSGKEIFHSDKFISVSGYDGKLIGADSTSKMHALDKSGNDIFPAADSIYWDAEGDVYVSITNIVGVNIRSSFSCYTEEGDKLPFPDSSGIDTLSPDRFIIISADPENRLYGLYDRSGKEILPQKYYELQRLNSNGLIVFTEQDDFSVTHSGVMDYSGNIIIPAGYDYIYSNYSGSLYYARSGLVYGLIDIKGNWIWKTSDYNSLMD